ncbi:MAG: TIGR03118 family protein [Methylovulum sp.]|nr:TIGR03118 family protein [Methylovulum sp.]
MAAQAAPPLHYKASNLVSNVPGVALHTDANLQNAWGLAFNPNGAIWVANNHSGTSTLYDGQGASIVGLPMINVPGAAGAVGSPTGIVFNSSQDFTVTPGNPAAFIFANEDGTLAAWNPKVDFLNAKLVGGTIPSPNPIYKGLALAANGSAHYLYATDFHNAKIQVFDSTFTWVDAKKTLGCNFADATIPTGFAPFGIHNIGGALYVTYAKQDANKEDDVAGPGLGYVRVFDANGCLVKRFASTGVLNAPWAVTLAPANFGVNSNKILVGNFGDGTIHAFALDNSVKPAPLLDANDKKIKIDGLWDLAFGNGVLGQNTNSLFFSAGPNDEVNGLYGKLDVAP